MGAAFIISLYLGSPKPKRLDEYAASTRTAIEANGGRFIVRGLPAHTYEDGYRECTIIIEFASFEQAMAAYESPSYQAARNY